MKKVFIILVSLFFLVSCVQNAQKLQLTGQTTRNEVKLLVHLVGNDSVNVTLWGDAQMIYHHGSDGYLFVRDCDSVKIKNCQMRLNGIGDFTIATNVTYIEER